MEAMKASQMHLEDVIEISKEFYLNMTFEETQMKGVKAPLNAPHKGKLGQRKGQVLNQESKYQGKINTSESKKSLSIENYQVMSDKTESIPSSNNKKQQIKVEITQDN